MGRGFVGMLLVTISSALVCGSATAEHFKVPVWFHASPDVFSVTAGDVNGDGRRDVVAVSRDSAWASVLLQKAGGGLEPAINSRLRFGSTYEAGVGDFNEDGRADLAAPGVDTNLLELFSGNSDGSFTFSRSYPAIDQAPSATAIGDVNSDGHLDIAVANYSPVGRAGIRLGVGDGAFGARLDFPTGIYPTDVALADLNADGKLDAVVTFSGYSYSPSDSVAIHLGNGDGSFAAGRSFRASSQPYYVGVGDLDNNGTPDLAVACADGNISVLHGLGDGTFGPPVNYPVSPTPTWVAIGDIDGDGWNDLAVTDPNDGVHPQTIALLINRRDGSFDPPIYEPVGVTPTGIVMEDFTGDGLVDIVISSRRLDSLYFLENCSPCIPTSIEAALLESFSNESGVHIRWSVSEGQGATAAVERRTETAAWQTRFGPEAITASLVSFDDSEVVPGERYSYRLTVQSSEGTITTPETWVEAFGNLKPRSVVLDRPSPNPSGGALRLRIGLPHDGPADLAVFDVQGRLIARISSGPLSAGWHGLTWDGKDQSGRPVPSGTYFLRLKAEKTISRRIAVLR